MTQSDDGKLILIIDDDEIIAAAAHFKKGNGFHGVSDPPEGLSGR